MSEPALSGVGLRKRFGRAVALRDVDFQVEAGQCLAVLGPNGAGKSTLLRLAAGLSRPTQGKLRVLGQPAASAAARARTGYIGHATQLYPALTARENLIFAARLYGVPAPDQRADRLLDEEGLGAVAHRSAGDFSRGMAQRLSIARSRVHDPPVLLLDEPFTGLDAASGEDLLTRLLALRDEGRALVLVDHDVELASCIASASLVLVRGRVALSAGGAPNPVEIERLCAENAA